MMEFSQTIFDLADAVIKGAVDKKVKVAGAESCTGGMISQILTSIPGSSRAFEFCIVSYANEAKRTILKIPEIIIDRYGAVSAETVGAMVDGVKKIYPVDLVFAVTGIAGPGGGTEQKPVGTVYIGIAGASNVTEVVKKVFSGDREEIRRKTVELVLNMLLVQLNKL